MGSLSAEEDGSSIEISDEYVLDAVINGKVLLLHSRICTTPLGLGICVILTLLLLALTNYGISQRNC